MNNQTGLPGSTQTPPKKLWRNWLERVGHWVGLEDRCEWLKDMRGNLSLVATVIATMTFQVAINPPGGVRPASDTGKVSCQVNGTDMDTCPGEAILAVVYSQEYLSFLVSNTICFVASLSVCLLLVSGIPLNNRFLMWLLSIGMCITLTSLALTYVKAVLMVTPDPIWGTYKHMYRNLLLAWIGLLGIVGLFFTVRFVVWAVNKFIRKRST